MPNKFVLDLCDFDVCLIDLADKARRPLLGEGVDDFRDRYNLGLHGFHGGMNESTKTCDREYKVRQSIASELVGFKQVLAEARAPLCT